MPNLMNPWAALGLALSICLATGMWWQGYRSGHAAALAAMPICAPAPAPPPGLTLRPGPEVPMTGGRRY